MPELYNFQKQAVEELQKPEKHIVVSGTGSGKSAISLRWAHTTTNWKWLVVTTAAARDSCFPAGTLVSTAGGQKRIEDVCVGDIVYCSMNDSLVQSRVNGLIVKDVEDALYKIKLSGGQSLTATADHLIYSGNGEYTPISKLKVGDTVYGKPSKNGRSTTKAQRSNREILKSQPYTPLSLVPTLNPATYKSPTRQVVEEGKDVLFQKVWQAGACYGDCCALRTGVSSQIPKGGRMLSLPSTSRQDNSNYACDLSQEQKVVLLPRLRHESQGVGEPKAQTKPQTVSRVTGEDYESTSRGSCQEWCASEAYPVSAKRFIRWRDRICDRDHGFASGMDKSRLRLAIREVSDRNRRGLPQRDSHQGTRQTQRRGLERLRVESVEVYRPGHTGTHRVYCLEVEEAHNFFANGVLVHNCQWLKELELWCPDIKDRVQLEVISWAGLAKWTVSNWDKINEYTFIFDEVARSKAGVSSAQGRAFLQITKRTDDWAGFTATPGDRWIDFQAYFVAGGYVSNKTAFIREFCQVQTFKGYPEIVGYHDEDTLKSWWDRMRVRPDTSALLAELPPERHYTHIFQPDAEYKRLMKTRTLKDGTFLDTSGALSAAARRACFNKAKQSWLTAYLHDLGEPCVLFYALTETGDKIEEIAKKSLPKGARVWRVYGGCHEIPIEETIGKYDVVVCQWQVGSEALNLQFMSQWVSVESCYAYWQAQQARGRIQRIGQQANHVTYHYLKCKDTIEEKIYEALRNKSEFAADTWYAELNK